MKLCGDMPSQIPQASAAVNPPEGQSQCHIPDHARPRGSGAVATFWAPSASAIRRAMKSPSGTAGRCATSRRRSSVQSCLSAICKPQCHTFRLEQRAQSALATGNQTFDRLIAQIHDLGDLAKGQAFKMAQGHRLRLSFRQLR